MAAQSRQQRRAVGRRRTAQDRHLIDRDCPPDLIARVRQAIALAISGQGILRDERLPGLVARVAPNALTFVAFEGYRVNLDLPQNTHAALCVGMVEFELRKA